MLHSSERNMKVYIPTYNRPHSLRTHFYFKDEDYYLLVHSEEQKKHYLENPTINPDRLIVTNAPKGITNQRKWMLDNAEPGEWYMSADDNIDYYELRGVPIQCKEFMRHAEASVEKANEIGAYLVGFATTSNLFFRKETWKPYSFVCGKTMLIRKGKAEHNPLYSAKEDYQFTAENLLQHGITLRNDDIFPKAKHYQEGGIGGFSARMPGMVKDTRRLMEDYPGAFRINAKRGMESEVLMTLHDQDAVNRWRFQMNTKRKREL